MATETSNHTPVLLPDSSAPVLKDQRVGEGKPYDVEDDPEAQRWLAARGDNYYGEPPQE